jgi:hypothetical protein
MVGHERFCSLTDLTGCVFCLLACNYYLIYALSYTKKLYMWENSWSMEIVITIHEVMVTDPFFLSRSKSGGGSIYICSHVPLRRTFHSFHVKQDECETRYSLLPSFGAHATSKSCHGWFVFLICICLLLFSAY